MTMPPANPTAAPFLFLMSLGLLLVPILIAISIYGLRGTARYRALAAIGLTVAVAAVGLGYLLLGPGRYAELEHLRSLLQRIPGVNVLDASGHDDLTFEVESFTIEVQDRGEIAFGALDRSSFEYSKHLTIHSIGGHVPIVVREGHIGAYENRTKEPMRSTGRGYGIGVGPRDPFARFFPFPLTNVQCVIGRFEEICDQLSKWPVQPAYGSFQDGAGVSYYYALKDPSSTEDWIAPTELEEAQD